MPYIGNELATQFQAFVTQTITGDGSTGYTLDRAVANGKELLVYINNVKQEEGSGKSYTASGTTITFSEAVASGDSCYLVYLGSAVQTVTPPDGSLASYTGNASISGTLGVTGAVTANGGAVFNEDSADVDFRVESNGQTHALFVDAGNDHVNINTDSDLGSTLNVNGEITIANANSGIIMVENAADANGSNFTMRKSRNTTLNGHTVVQDGDTTGNINFQGSDGDEFLSTASISSAVDGTPGNNDMPGRLVFSTTANGGSSPAERMRISEAGLISFFKTSFDETADGVHFDPSGLVTITRANGTAFVINRQSSDGTLVDFRNANSTEGTIGISGSTVSYNGFSGLHESSGIASNVAIGTVVSTIDELDVYPNKQKSSVDNSEEDHPKAGQTRADHAKIKISDSVGDKRVYGVLQSYDDNGKPLVASVGIGSIRVTGACEGGDLLESNGDGTAKVQSDDIIRSKTIGKVTIGNSSTDVKLVSCVLYCG
jgi:hypothetical protein